MTEPINNPRHKTAPGENPDGTGLPTLRTWPAVYIFVLAVFVLLVILLALFTRAYA